MESGERNADNSGPPLIERVLAALIPIVLIVGMMIAAIILSRRGAFDRPREPVAVAPSSSPTPARPAPQQPPPQVEIAAPLPDASTSAPVVDVPVVEEPQAPEPGPAARFCLSVGSYLFEDRAREKAKSLARRSGQKVWVESAVVGDSRTFRILLGAFPTEADAERAADRLLSRGLVSEALVENLPGTSAQR
jgi:cell division septation protein DedD